MSACAGDQVGMCQEKCAETWDGTWNEVTIVSFVFGFPEVLDLRFLQC